MVSIFWVVYLVAAVTVDCRYLNGHNSQNTSIEEPTEEFDIESADGLYAVDDMVLNEVQWAALRQRKAIDGTTFRWKEGTGVFKYPRVPYVFRSNAVGKFKDAVMAGIKHWQKHTCIMFDTNVQMNEDHLQFDVVDDQGIDKCSSYVGRQDGKSGQTIAIGTKCRKLSTVVHEIGHAIGFIHEHQRSERDTFINILDNNIDLKAKEKKTNFDTMMNYKSHNVDYDMSSIMHYRENHFAFPDKLTIIAVDPLNQELLGGKELSYRDKLLANKMYNCLDKWKAKCIIKGKDPCLPDGYTDGKNCNCVCSPEATATGSTCQKNNLDHYANLRNPLTEKITEPTKIKINSSIKASTEFVKWIDPPKCKMAKVKFTLYDNKKLDCKFQYLNIRKKSNDLEGDRLCPDELEKLPTIRPIPPYTDIIIRMKNYLNYDGQSITPVLEADVEFEDRVAPGCPVPVQGYDAYEPDAIWPRSICPSSGYSIGVSIDVCSAGCTSMTDCSAFYYISDMRGCEHLNCPMQPQVPEPTGTPSGIQAYSIQSGHNWCASIFKMDSSWYHTVSGWLVFTVPINVSSWNLELTFNKDITDLIIWNLEREITSARMVTLTPKHWNINQVAGTILRVNFQIKFGGSDPSKLISAKLNGDELC